MMELIRDEDTRHLVLTHYGTSLFFNALEEEDLRDWLSRPVPEPDPTPSPRRLENRVATLEDSKDGIIRAHNIAISRIDGLEERLGEMADTLGEVIGFNAELTEQVKGLTTPDQPAAPRIDPDDKELIQLVSNCLADGPEGWIDNAQYIVNQVAYHLNRRANA